VRDPEEAIVRAVNDTVDNDTIGAIVRAVVGAMHGKRRLPARWLDDLLGRTAEADDGRVFELITAARSLWWVT
jgi:ADP-ribosyl-[dinitrogen reductase] hydrolase